MYMGTHTGRRPRALTQWFAVLAGAGYVLGGLVGFFFTGFDSWLVNGNEGIWILDLNGFHNIVHIGVGALWLFGAFWLMREGTEGVNLAIGGVYVLAAALGYLGFLGILSIDGPFAADNFLHLITGLAALVFAGWAGLLSPQAAERADRERSGV